jgi:SAM-dependent methyltransferase
MVVTIKDKMKTILNIPDEAIKYILFQQTSYLKFPHNCFYRKLKKISPISLYNTFVNTEAYFRRVVIKRLYCEDMSIEYETIKDHLPQTCENILDIGCGMAGIDIFLFQHYQSDTNIDYFLFDKTKINQKVFYGYKEKIAFYNSLILAKSFLRLNGIDKSKIHLIEIPSNNKISIDCSFDLVISLISWGFHYPLSKYLDGVYELLNENGTLILDLRKTTEDKAILQDRFSSVKQIAEGQKYYRILATK